MISNDESGLTLPRDDAPAALAPRAVAVEYAEPGFRGGGGPDDGAGAAGGGMVSYLHSLRRKWLAAFFVGLLLAAVAGPAVWVLHRPTYTTSAMLKIASSQDKILPTANSFDATAFDLYKATQQQYLKSRFVLISALRQKEEVDNEMIEVGQIPFIKRELDPVDWLAREIHVSFPGDAEFMNVSLRGDEPVGLAALVNAVVDAYMTEVINVEQERRRQKLNEVDRMYAEKETEWRRKRTDLKDLAKLVGGATKSEALTVKQQTMMQQLAAFRTELVSVQLRKIRLETDMVGRIAELKRLENLGEGPRKSSVPAPEKSSIPAAEKTGQAASPAVESWVSEEELDAAMQADPVASRLIAEIEQTGRTLADSRVVAGPNGGISGQRNRMRLEGAQQQLLARRDEVRRVLEQRKPIALFSAVRSEIRRIEAELKTVTELEERLTKTAESFKIEAGVLGEQSIEVEIMAQEISLMEGVLRQLADQRQTMAIELQSKQPRVTVVYRADPPVAPDRGKKYEHTASAVLLAFCLPLVGLVWWDSRSRRISSPDEVTAETGLDIIGSVPQIPDRVVRRRGLPAGRSDYWRMLMNESIDGITARLLFRAERDHIRVVLVSSAMGGEGKTTLSTQLSMSLARTGRRTLLVDFDLRQPSIDQVFALPLEPGVSDILRSEVDFHETIHSTSIDHLYVMPAGEEDRQALASLANGGIKGLLHDLRKEFDFVIIDASPILPVVDVRFICRHVDGVVFSVLRDVSQVPKIQAACEVLAGFGIRPLGAVVVGSRGETYYYRRSPALDSDV